MCSIDSNYFVVKILLWFNQQIKRGIWSESMHLCIYVNVFTANDIEISSYVKRSPSNNVKFQTQIKYKIN